MAGSVKEYELFQLNGANAVGWLVRLFGVISGLASSTILLKDGQNMVMPGSVVGGVNWRGERCGCVWVVLLLVDMILWVELVGLWIVFEFEVRWSCAAEALMPRRANQSTDWIISDRRNDRSFGWNDRRRMRRSTTHETHSASDACLPSEERDFSRVITECPNLWKLNAS
ncbi:unnamed protein product [Anisakis simplex]|uniref:Transmembrane protein n=1 Tax=Anisakis simplex TaxID=6269 RepID=A0A0M3JV27_ANISI|nr:unnamed protein product [Anisakis simplex]